MSGFNVTNSTLENNAYTLKYFTIQVNHSNKNENTLKEVVRLEEKLHFNDPILLHENIYLILVMHFPKLMNSESAKWNVITLEKYLECLKISESYESKTDPVLLKIGHSAIDELTAISKSKKQIYPNVQVQPIYQKIGCTSFGLEHIYRIGAYMTI